MAIGVIFAGLIVAAGLVAARGFRLPGSTAPFAGLALIAVTTSWCALLGAPLAASTWLLFATGLVAFLLVRPKLVDSRALPLTLLCVATAIPPLLLGTAFADLETPLSTHDGAFHVETVDALRRGVHLQTWYPIGFHASAAAALSLVPWVDSALGTADIGLGLGVLAPLAVFGLARGFGFAPTVASIAAAIAAVTWTYPYDYQLWAGWPQGMGVLLVLGLWSVALGWLREPNPRWSVLFGLLVAAVVLTHGIDLYSAAIGLLFVAGVKWRRIAPRQLLIHGSLAGAVAVLAAAPYLPTLLNWARIGGATEVGAQAADRMLSTSGDWLLQNATGVTGAATLVDLPLRTALLAVGLAVGWRSMRALALAWVGFAVLSLAGDLTDAPQVRWLFAVTFPWLSDQRPREIAVILASLLGAIGVATCWGILRSFRISPISARRLAVAFALLIGFFAEGTGVSIYKRLVANVALQDSFTADDGAAMAWLKQHASVGSVVINDRTADAGIWTPYKADLPILLPRSAPGDQTARREPILDHVLDLNRDPMARQQACALGAGYVYSGARSLAFESRQLPDRVALEHAPYLREVFSSGEAAVFQIELPCADGYG